MVKSSPDLREASSLNPCTEQGLYWVFGYGSLIWRPGFSFESKALAEIEGFQRKLCIYSHIHRGTPACPGLVFGLAAGGFCQGMAFGVRPEDWPETLAYLREREQPNGVYIERQVKTKLAGGVRVKALTFVAETNHGQFAGDLDIETALPLIQQGHGQSGACTDYVLNCYESLRALGIEDLYLASVSKQLNASC